MTLSKRQQETTELHSVGRSGQCARMNQTLMMFAAANVDGQCQGKCLVHTDGGIQGALLSVTNQFAGAGGKLSPDLSAFKYFAQAYEGAKFYGRGLNVNDDGHAGPIELLSFPEAVPPVEYLIQHHPDGTKTCVSGTPEMPTIDCVSENATKLVSGIRVGNKDHFIHVDAYVDLEGWDNKPDDRDAGTVHVLMDDCTPVAILSEGKAPDGRDRAITLLFGNYEPKIEDMNVFNVPEVCK